MCTKGSTASQVYSPPPEVMANYNALTKATQDVAATPFTQYTGEMVAPLTPTQETGITNINAAAGLAQPYYEAATPYVQQAGTPFGQQALDQYMSPYLNDVVSSTLANLNETNAQQRQQLLGNQITQGAFGGDRGSIAQAELARQQNLAEGQTLANVLQGGYGQALGQFNADQARALQVGSTLGQLGTAQQAAGLQGAQAQLQAGAQQQAVQQAQDVANQQQFQAAQAYPFQTNQYLANILLGVGGQSGGTALTTTPAGNVGSQLLGGLLTAGQIFGMSDERVKENMEPVGKSFDGQTIYKFNYKGDPKTNIGLSAQEVEKHKPSAVHKVEGDLRMVDYNSALSDAARRGHFGLGGVPDWMGGAVHEGLGRAHYANEGTVPYSDQPSGGSTKPLTLADVMRISQSLLDKKVGTKLTPQGIPSAPAAEKQETMMDISDKLKNATPAEKAGLGNMVNNLKSTFGLGTVSAQDVLGTPGQRVGDVSSLYSSPIGPMQSYADGGLVGRRGYADGQDVQPAPSQGQNTGGFKPRTLAEMVVGHPLSDEANLGVLAAGLGMLSSKSPNFATSIGEGATQGLGTYFNTIANERAYEKQLRDLQLTEEQRQIERGRLAVEQGGLGLRGIEANIAIQNADQNILNNLMQRAQSYLTVPGGQVPAELQAQIDAVNSRMANRQAGISMVGTSAPQMGGLVAAPTNAVLGAGPNKNVMVSPDKSVTTPAPAAESTTTPEVKLTTKAPAETVATTQPQPQPQVAPLPKSRWGLPDDMDPDVLEADARNNAAQGFGTVAAAKQAKADKNREMLTKEGGLYVNGQFQSVPGWKEDKANQAGMVEGVKAMVANDQTEAKNYVARQEVENRVQGMLDIMQDFQTGAFASQRNNLVKKLNDLGFTVPKSAQINPDAFIEFTKNAYAQLFENAKAVGGRLLVSTLSGLQKAGADAGNTPASNAYILAHALGALKYQDQLTQEYSQWRQSDEGKRATSSLSFDLSHADEKKLAQFQNDIARQVTYVGQEGPATNMPRDQLVNGQRYRFKDGSKKYWNAGVKDSQGRQGIFQDNDPLAGG